MNEEAMKALQNYLQENGLKNTRQRQVIAETFFNMDTHVKIEDLLTEVKKKEPSVGYVTVYRTLMLLKECGLAHQRNFNEGQSLFENATEHHDHLICIKCGKIVEFEDDRIEALQEEIANKFHFVLISHRHEMYGACSACQRE